MEQTMSEKPIEAAVHKQMEAIGSAIDDLLPEGWGFALLMFPLGDRAGRMNYMSSANREDMIAALKELIANFEGRGFDAPSTKQ
jgi:hypothetical protein